MSAHSDQQDLEAVFALSEIDLNILRLRKQLDDLPQKQQILAVRGKVKELDGKRAQVEKMALEVNRTLKLLADETQLTQGQIAGAQALLDASSDYRQTQALVAEMEMLSHRQSKLEEDELVQLEKQEKVSGVLAQITEAAAALAAEEESITNSYKDSGGQLKQEIARQEAARNTLMATLPPAWQSKYQRALEYKHDIGAVHLAGNQCSGCHSTLSEGQLDKLLSGPAVGECPNCNRLMAVAGSVGQ